MEPIPISGYYNFGFNNCLIKAVGLSGRSRTQALSMLDAFFRNLDYLELQVTRVIAEDLYAYRLEMGTKKDEKITDEEGESIAKEMDVEFHRNLTHLAQ